jgi:hypothetical protein
MSHDMLSQRLFHHAGHAMQATMLLLLLLLLLLTSLGTVA